MGVIFGNLPKIGVLSFQDQIKAKLAHDINSSTQKRPQEQLEKSLCKLYCNVQYILANLPCWTVTFKCPELGQIMELDHV